MSGLREELERIAEQAPRVVVPADTWRRGQRARRRSVALAVATSAAALALVVGYGAQLVDGAGRQADPAGTADEGVPSRIWSVPERMLAQGNDSEWLRDEVEDDLAIGRGAAAYVMNEALPVVIDAARGDYHLLDLPDYIGNRSLNRQMMADGTRVALSPDGTQLAYAWAGPAPESDTRPMPSGIRVVTLETGEIRTVPIRGGRGTMVTDIGWSPGSSWIVWRGRQMAYWTDSSTGASDPVAGRVGPGATASQELPLAGGQPTLAVADSGVVARLHADRLVRWDEEVRSRARLRAKGSFQPLGAFAPDARRVSLGTWVPQRGLSVLDTAAGRIDVRPLVLSGDLDPQGAELRALGWIDNELMVAQVTPVDTASPAERQIVVMTRERGPDSTYRIVARTDHAIGAASLTIAVDLMTLDRPTVERSEPEWPWSPERRALTVGLAVLVVLAFAVAARGWRRSRRPTPS